MKPAKAIEVALKRCSREAISRGAISRGMDYLRKSEPEVVQFFVYPWHLKSWG